MSKIEVDAIGLFLSTLKVVLIPVITGIILNRTFPDKTKKFVKVGPSLAVILITLIVASIIGEGKDIILSSGLSLLFSIMTLHFLGFFLGYFISRIFFIPNRDLVPPIKLSTYTPILNIIHPVIISFDPMIWIKINFIIFNCFASWLS